MLISLAMRDMVFPGHVEVTLAEGLCVLTGETGAGKSILLDAQTMALGGKASARLVAPGCTEAHCFALFAVPEGHPVCALLTARGIEVEGEVALRRILGAEGRSRAYINEVPVGVALLREAGQMLAETHGQHDTQHLFEPAWHRTILDGYGALAPKLARVRESYEAWREAEKTLEEFQTHEGEYAQRAEEAASALAEFALLQPEAGLEEKLAAERSLLRQGETMQGGLDSALADIEGEEAGALGQLHRLIHSLEKLGEQASGSLDTLLQALERASSELEEAREEAASLLHLMRADPERLERIEDRLYALRELARKYNVSADGLISLKARLEEDVAKGKDIDAARKKLQSACEKAGADYFHEAKALSSARHHAAREMVKAVNAELPALQLAHARFEILIEASEKPQAEGIDKIRFLAATEPKRSAENLSHIASGGELSRFMLALKLVSAARQGAQSLIFDEIDAGLSGAAAEAVGIRLARLAKSVQVLVVTHAPQVAVHAGHHVRVVKAEKGGRFTASAEVLTGKAREEEIARMIAGLEITGEARAAARRLMVT